MTKAHHPIASLLGMALLLGSAPALADVKAGVDAWGRGDYQTAISEWRGPADKGDADAQFNLGQAYKLGRGVPQDLVQAEKWYKKAADQGHLQASDNYGLVLFQSNRRAEALPYLQASAQRGEPRAQYVLGTGHFNGDFVEKDWVKAYALMTRASAQQLPQATTNLAQMDRFIPIEDRRRAIELVKAAASGDWRVQLGAFSDEAKAKSLWNSLEGRVSALSGLQPYLVKAGGITRLQAGPFTTQTQAEAMCKSVKASGNDCITKKR